MEDSLVAEHLRWIAFSFSFQKRNRLLNTVVCMMQVFVSYNDNDNNNYNNNNNEHISRAPFHVKHAQLC